LLVAITAAVGMALGLSSSDASASPPDKTPTISSFLPTSGPPGTVVTISGRWFQQTADVSFNGTPASTYTVDSANQISASVPSGASSGPISVTSRSGTGTSTDIFTVTAGPPPPTITSFSPQSGPVGTTVTITGSALTGASAVSFNGTPASAYTVDSDTQLSADVPAGASSGPLSVTTPGGSASSTGDFQVTAPAPPGTVAEDSFQRTVTGGWGTSDVGGSWSILDSPAGWSVTPGAGSISVPATAEDRAVLGSVSVQDADLLAEIVLPRCTSGGTNCDSYVVGRYTAGTPTYYRVGLVQGAGRSTVYIRAQRSDGSNLFGDLDTGIAAADGVVVWLRVEFQGVNPTTIRARAWQAGTTEPSTWLLNTTDNTAAEQTAGAVGVRARNEDGGAAHNFAFESYQATTISPPPPPTISGFSPSSGSVGTPVTISGTNLTSASAVSFNGTSATSFTVNSDTQLSASVPSGASSGPISVTTAGGSATSTASFTVTAPVDRTVTTGAFQVQWSQTDPEEITNLSWNGSPNLTNTWTNPGQCPGDPDLEFFGNGWGTGGSGVHPVLVGGGTTGMWSSQSSQGSTEVDIVSSATGCPPQTFGIPVTTTYQIPSSGNKISVQRTFSFGTTPFAYDLRPYIPRLYPENQYTRVIHPDAAGTGIVTENQKACDGGCQVTNWDGTWFAVHNPGSGQGMIVKRTSPPSPVALSLWVDQDGGSSASASSVLLLQPSGGFTGTVTEAESFCFYNSSIWTPGLTLPSGC
jgi:hypothetical protein